MQNKDEFETAAAQGLQRSIGTKKCIDRTTESDKAHLKYMEVIEFVGG